MRPFCYEFQIDGKPILTPDEDLKMEFTDLDSDESGRDEGGFMHRIVLREGIRTWNPTYSTLTYEEYRYMESLFKGKSEFTWRFRGFDGYPDECTAHRAKHSIIIRNALTGIIKNYSFNIIES